MGIALLTERAHRVLSQWLSKHDPVGQGLVEYALILVLVVIVVLVLVAFLGPWVGNVFSNVVNNL
jgi:pilus assembly protein Flp/PilA